MSENNETLVQRWHREATSPKPVEVTPFQQRVKPWMDVCFGPEISADRVERNDRFMEEALELVQASGYPKERAYALIEYVYGRDQGEINQEVGGVMVTLAAHCLAHGVDMHEAAETELARIWTKVEQIRAKQAAKPTGSALPIATPTPPAGDEGLVKRQAALIDAVMAMRETARELRDNSDGDCNAIMQAIHWEQRANDLEALTRTEGEV